jgi:hypothetical protein
MSLFKEIKIILKAGQLQGVTCMGSLWWHQITV